MFKSIYRGRRILITGHTGFKGSWLASWLVLLGADVAGFSSHISTQPSAYLSMGLSNKVNDFRGDIRNRAELQKIISEFEPEIIFHLAAQTQCQESYLDPPKTFETNILGTLNILEAVRQCPAVKVIICISSDSCYRANSHIYSYRENDPLGGNTPYSASKSCAEHISLSYFESFFKDKVACATVRSGNIIGGGDWAKNRLIAECFKAWITNNPITIRNPNQIYPWLYVLEPLSGYLSLGALLFQGGQESLDLSCQAYNFGTTSNENHSIAEVLKLLPLNWPNFQSTIIAQEDLEEQKNPVFKLCIAKALEKLQWKSVLDFEETVRYTAEWYSAFYSKEIVHDEKNMFSYTAGQISAYENAASNRGLLWTR